jgi:DNA invertase Pin-like site-specific DNA recombinase
MRIRIEKFPWPTSALVQSRPDANFPAGSRGASTPAAFGRGADFGLPERAGLIDLARTYLDAQARLWPELVGTPALPVAMPATVEPMADDFERRFRKQQTEVFRPSSTPKLWTDLGIAYLSFSDEGSNPRSLDQQLINVLNRARCDGVFIPWQYVCADAAVSGTLSCRRGYALAKFLVERRAETGAAWFVIDDLSRMSRNTIESLQLGELAADTGARVVGASDGFDSAGQQSKIMLPMMSSFNEVFIDQLKSKVKRGMDDAFRRGENIQPPGVGYRMVPVTNPNGSLVFTHKGTVEKRAEIDPDAAASIRRGAEMIAYEGRSPIDVARLFNEQKVGGKATWSDNRVRKLYTRERLVGREVFRTTKQVRDRQTGCVRHEKLRVVEWLTRESPHLRILSDELAMAVPPRPR